MFRQPCGSWTSAPKNRGRPHQKVRFPAASVVGRNFLTPRHPGIRVRNVRGKSGPKSLCLCCFFFPDNFSATPQGQLNWTGPIANGSETFGGSQKGGFQRGGFGGCSPGTKTGTRARSPKPPFWKPPFYLPNDPFWCWQKGGFQKGGFRRMFPPERKPERGYVRQNHPFTKPPFYLTLLKHQLLLICGPRVGTRGLEPLPGPSGKTGPLRGLWVAHLLSPLRWKRTHLSEASEKPPPRPWEPSRGSKGPLGRGFRDPEWLKRGVEFRGL